MIKVGGSKMKNVRRVLILMLILVFSMSTITFADEITWENSPGHHNQSKLLDKSIESSKDVVRFLGRGEILAEGSVEIINKKDGRIYISVDTLAHRRVDRIYHKVFLEQWDESEQDWRQLESFQFSKTKEQDSNLSVLLNSFSVGGYPTNKYYRVRGLHMVELGDWAESCATETDGVLITKK